MGSLVLSQGLRSLSLSNDSKSYSFSRFLKARKASGGGGREEKRLGKPFSLLLSLSLFPVWVALFTCFSKDLLSLSSLFFSIFYLLSSSLLFLFFFG